MTKEQNKLKTNDNGLDSSAQIEYKYLNMDTGRFHETQEDMVKYLSKGSLLQAIPNYQYNQYLITGGRAEFNFITQYFH